MYNDIDHIELVGEINFTIYDYVAGIYVYIDIKLIQNSNINTV